MQFTAGLDRLIARDLGQRVMEDKLPSGVEYDGAQPGDDADDEREGQDSRLRSQPAHRPRPETRGTNAAANWGPVLAWLLL